MINGEGFREVLTSQNNILARMHVMVKLKPALMQMREEVVGCSGVASGS